MVRRHLLVSRNDQPHHRKAVESARQRRVPLVTTAWVVTEIADGLAAPPPLRKLFAQILASLENDATATIVKPDDALMRRGLKLYADRPDQEWSLTDCISFVVMKDRHIREALTGDHHFEQAGFVALLK